MLLLVWRDGKTAGLRSPGSTAPGVLKFGERPLRPTDNERRLRASPLTMGLFGAIKKAMGRKKAHVAEVIDLRSVVVANNIEDVYTVQRRLGEGQTAVVLEGIRLADGKSYALKGFRMAEMRGTCEGLRDEVKVLRALPEHPSIVGLREIVSTPGCVYLAMELVAGGDLLSPIEEHGAYSERAALKLFAQMVDAVDCMHRQGIVHRDLKPENVCFTHRSRQKLKVRVCFTPSPLVRRSHSFAHTHCRRGLPTHVRRRRRSFAAALSSLTWVLRASSAKTV